MCSSYTQEGCTSAHIGVDGSTSEALYVLTFWQDQDAFKKFQQVLERDPETSKELLAISKDFMEPLRQETLELIEF
ncbi:MAG: antibiotic biosynthesis monooxygenase [Promethearchaeota archaeon]